MCVRELDSKWESRYCLVEMVVCSCFVWSCVSGCVCRRCVLFCMTEYRGAKPPFIASIIHNCPAICATKDRILHALWLPVSVDPLSPWQAPKVPALSETGDLTAGQPGDLSTTWKVHMAWGDIYVYRVGCLWKPPLRLFSPWWRQHS